MDKVFVFGFIIFAVVIVFSIFVEVDTIRKERTEPEYISTPASEIEKKVFSLSGGELRSYLRSLRGRHIRLSGRVEVITMSAMEMSVPGMKRRVKISIPKRIRKELSLEDVAVLRGEIRRIHGKKDRLIFELTNVSLGGK